MRKDGGKPRYGSLGEGGKQTSCAAKSMCPGQKNNIVVSEAHALAKQPRR